MTFLTGMADRQKDKPNYIGPPLPGSKKKVQSLVNQGKQMVIIIKYPKDFTN